LASSRVRYSFRTARSVLSDEKKLSRIVSDIARAAH
jgi:hypothetical protein